jgi:CRP-like cAMP-binding protein
MMIETAQRIEFLRRVHLFYRLEDAHFESVAQTAQEKIFEPGEVILRQGDMGDRFYMIYSGNVIISREKAGGEKTLAKLVPGDYFGEEALLTNHRRNATVTAEGKAVLLTLSRADFHQLLKTVRQLKSNFAVAVDSHRLARSLKFKWLQESDGEVIYFLARKHPLLLFRRLILPVILGTIAFLGLLSGLLIQNPWLLWLCVAGFGLIFGWGAWNTVDWSNDYYIVTNKRVVWLEKVVGIYDSRQEAPLSAIQRINVQTEFLGRQMDYGNLIIRTIVGSSLNLRNVNHPYQAAALVEEHWKRSKQTSRRMEEDAMRQALRERLLRKTPAPPVVPTLVEKAQPKKSPFTEQKGLANFFRVRFEGMSTITYRKHWVVLLEKTWLPSLILLVLIAALILGVTRSSLMGFSAGTALLTVWFLLTGIVFVWWYYRYIDWSNDIFQVTPDQILDISKKPLGEVTSDIASLDNILHLEYERRGLAQVLFNYGNVYITIGGGKDMTFEDVYNPSAVQDDIERRRLERISKKEDAAVKAERERMADWFAAYHHSTEEIRRGEEEEKKADEQGEQEPPAA